MKKIFVALSMVAFLAACDDSSSASAGSNDEPTTLSSAEELGSSSSVKSGSDEPNLSSAFEKKMESSSSEKLSDTSSNSADKVEPSSSENSSSSAMETITSSDGSVYDSSSNTLTDLRDGQTYKTVKIGDQVWMAENLNYETDNSFCYNDSAEYCEKYGRLYTWAAAMDSAGTWSTNGKGCGYGKTCSPTYPVRGVCPEGWRLLTRTEWETLFNAVGGQSVAGTKLKSTSGWNGNGNGTDAFSFSALPAGYRYYNGDFSYEGSDAYFWSFSEYSSFTAFYVSLGYDYDYASLLSYEIKYYGFSVRCVKD